MLSTQISSTPGVYARNLVHQTPCGREVETPLLAVAYHKPDQATLSNETPAQPAIFLDRDGVINRFAHFRRPQDYDKFCHEGAIDSIVRLMQSSPMPVYIVSNQQRAEEPKARQQVEQALDRLAELVVENGGKFAGVLYCPNLSYKPVPKDSINGHKPGPGMFLEIARRDHLDLANSIMVGDSVKDMLAAKSAHPEMKTVLVKTGHGGRDKPLPHPPEAWAEALPQAVDWILAQA